MESYTLGIGSLLSSLNTEHQYCFRCKTRMSSRKDKVCYAHPMIEENSSRKRPKTNSTKKKKLKLPTTFLNAQSLEFVVGPHHQLVTTPVASDVVKEVFLDRLVKEIVQPFLLRRYESSNDDTACRNDRVMTGRKSVASMESHNRCPLNLDTNSNHQDETAKCKRKRRIKERIVMGTNQCSRLLERVLRENDATDLDAKKQLQRPSLIVLAKDTYPPTVLAHIPVLAQQLNIPVLLLPGKASVELGRALNVRMTSILMFLPFQGCADDPPSLITENDPIDSFVAFIKSHM
jgi:hypothetical protein